VSIALFFLLSGFFLAALLGATERSRKLQGIAGACLVAIACIIVFLRPVQLPPTQQLLHGTTTTTLKVAPPGPPGAAASGGVSETPDGSTGATALTTTTTLPGSTTTVTTTPAGTPGLGASVPPSQTHSPEVASVR
jgi:hypothetical protein